MEIEPKDCAVIEDTTPGITAALRAGMYCIAYANATSGDQDFSGANKIIHSMYDIITDGLDTGFPTIYEACWGDHIEAKG